MTLVKICGITDEQALYAAAEAGAAFAGFVFYPPSPRAVTAEQAAALCRAAPPDLKRVGLFVDPDDEMLHKICSIVPLDMIQLHGTESPERTAAIAAHTGLPIVKALRISSPTDIAQARHYEDSAAWLLFDAHPEGAALPGGTGCTFDWSWLEGFQSARPWMLSGGLNEGNIAAALSRLSPDAVDVSSGVEDRPGQKNAVKITAFVNAVRSI